MSKDERILSVEVPFTEASKFVDFVRSLGEKLTIIERETSRAEPAMTPTQSILIGIGIDVTAQVLYDILKYAMTKKYKIRFLRQGREEHMEKETIVLPYSYDVVDPFDVPLNVFKYLDIDQIDDLYQLLHKKYGDWIRKRLRESNAQFIVVCDQKVVLTSNDPYGPPAEKVKELANQFGKACYTVGGAVPVEELALYGFQTYSPYLG